MSCGFAAHPAFSIVGAVDAQNGKPSAGPGTLECNRTYQTNIGIAPLSADLKTLGIAALRQYLAKNTHRKTVDVLISCAPCTGFSRTVRRNLIEDDPRNSLVVRTADFVAALKPRVFLMENVGELLEGKFAYHFQALAARLREMGYRVHGSVHSLDQYGLPQRRTRALVIAVRGPLRLRTIDDLWEGHKISSSATHVRRAIGGLPPIKAGQVCAGDPMHVSPNFSEKGLARLRLIPANGGSWPDLLKVPGGAEYLIPSMKWYVDQGRVGPHPDVYGRLAWDAPAVTLKRECAHTGNGRYAHPEQDRLCTVREMALLQGFPRTYEFVADSLSNMYRHIGDAVPPIVSYQLAWLAHWILTDSKPAIEEVLLPDTHLKSSDIEHRTGEQIAISGI